MSTDSRCEDPALRTAIAELTLPGLLIGHRLITEGDEEALFPSELAPYAKAIATVRRASGAARIVARRLLVELGQPPAALPRNAAGVPQWPDGIVGSLSHDPRVALAALGWRRQMSGLGIDVEPALPLPDDLLDIVATPREKAAYGSDPLAGRLLFVLKEAVYKAAYPLDGVFLDHHEVEIDLAGQSGLTRYGRRVEFRFRIASHIVGLAFIGAEAA